MLEEHKNQGPAPEPPLAEDPAALEDKKAPGPRPGAGPRMEDFVSLDLLRALAESSEGFRFQPDPTLPPQNTGYTIIEKKTIYYNPLLLKGDPEHGIPAWSKTDVQGFSFHEVGHHVTEVLAFDALLREKLPDIEIPEGYRGDRAAEERFLGAIRSHLQNGLVDVWLESFMGRRPYYPVREAITAFQKGKGEPDDYRQFPEPDQFLQFLLRTRYLGDEGWREKLSPAVAEAYRKVKNSGALQAVMDRSVFENYFSSPGDRERAVARKGRAYDEVFLPEYLKLMHNELERRKEERRQQKSGEGQPGSGRPGSGSAGAGSPRSQSVPLTKEEEQELIKQILQELEKAGEAFRSQAPSDEDRKNASRLLQAIKEAVGARAQPEPGTPPASGHEAEGAEALSAMFEQFMREFGARQRRGLAAAFQVREESVGRWEQIREKHHDEIQSLAARLADVFLEDRRWRHEFMRREGEIVPGLEYETVAALISGQTDPDTKFRTVQAPEFLELEIEWIVDNSGSMSGEPVAESVALLVVVTEALKQVRDSLSAEGLVAEDEQPLRVGVTKFSVAPERVSELSEPLSPEKELKIVDRVSMTGGGTTESESLEGVYKGMKLRAGNVLKIMVMLSDGEGDRQGVWPIVRQIEEDNDVIFLAVSLANNDSGEAVIDTYARALIKDPKDTNVAVMHCRNVKELLSDVADFIKAQVEDRRSGR